MNNGLIPGYATFEQAVAAQDARIASKQREREAIPECFLRDESEPEAGWILVYVPRDAYDPATLRIGIPVRESMPHSEAL